MTKLFHPDAAREGQESHAFHEPTGSAQDQPGWLQRQGRQPMRTWYRHEEVHHMIGHRAVIIVATLVLAACSSTGRDAATPHSQQIECERSGGAWRAVLKLCEYRQPS
ncbi:MAG TPA: hypothetical protein VFQ62_19435 [Methylomirabilota bacterium]|nr:hypothetical protein [Methylomirabilota bacterium]